MAATNSTTNLGLPQWVATDKPEMTDFNTAFSDIDSGLWQIIYPVGSLYETTNAAFNPATSWGGTWELYGQGRVVVGVDSGDTDFDASGETGGSKTQTLSVDQLPSHQHYLIVDSNSGTIAQTNGSGCLKAATSNLGRIVSPANGIEIGTAISETGSGSAHNNLQPYITAYRWRRTA